MNGRRYLVALALALSLTTTGCDWFHRRKPQPIPPQAQAPTQTAPQPAPQPPPATTTPPAQAAPEKPAEETAQKPKPRTKPSPTHARTTKPAATAPAAQKPVEQAAAPPSRIVIQEGSTADTSNAQISTPATHDESTDRQRTTQQLLDSTDANLHMLHRTLSSDEQAMVEAIKSYMQQSRDASKDGDAVRAHNLALKAHLLSDELVKR